MSQWSKPWDYKLPSGPNVTMADYMLAYRVRTDLLNAIDNFLTHGKMGPQYTDPMSYIDNTVNYAISLTQNNYATKYAPPSWDAAQTGINSAFSCFDMLKQLPSSQVDPSVTTSIWDAWNGNVSTTPVTLNDGKNTSTGPSAVQFGTIFGGSK